METFYLNFLKIIFLIKIRVEVQNLLPCRLLLIMWGHILYTATSFFNLQNDSPLPHGVLWACQNFTAVWGKFEFILWTYLKPSNWLPVNVGNLLPSGLQLLPDWFFPDYGDKLWIERDFSNKRVTAKTFFVPNYSLTHAWVNPNYWLESQAQNFHHFINKNGAFPYKEMWLNAHKDCSNIMVNHHLFCQHNLGIPSAFHHWHSRVCFDYTYTHLRVYITFLKFNLVTPIAWVSSIMHDFYFSYNIIFSNLTSCNISNISTIGTSPINLFLDLPRTEINSISFRNKWYAGQLVENCDWNGLSQFMKNNRLFYGTDLFNCKSGLFKVDPLK